jgi:hypothetical protein
MTHWQSDQYADCSRPFLIFWTQFHQRSNEKMLQNHFASFMRQNVVFTLSDPAFSCFVIEKVTESKPYTRDIDQQEDNL